MFSGFGLAAAILQAHRISILTCLCTITMCYSLIVTTACRPCSIWECLVGECMVDHAFSYAAFIHSFSRGICLCTLMFSNCHGHVWQLEYIIVQSHLRMNACMCWRNAKHRGILFTLLCCVLQFASRLLVCLKPWVFDCHSSYYEWELIRKPLIWAYPRAVIQLGV